MNGFVYVENEKIGNEKEKGSHTVEGCLQIEAPFGPRHDCHFYFLCTHGFGTATSPDLGICIASNGRCFSIRFNSGHNISSHLQSKAMCVEVRYGTSPE
jgi:hypothetical protein